MSNQPAGAAVAPLPTQPPLLPPLAFLPVRPPSSPPALPLPCLHLLLVEGGAAQALGVQEQLATCRGWAWVEYGLTGDVGKGFSAWYTETVYRSASACSCLNTPAPTLGHCGLLLLQPLLQTQLQPKAQKLFPLTISIYVSNLQPPTLGHLGLFFIQPLLQRRPQPPGQRRLRAGGVGAFGARRRNTHVQGLPGGIGVGTGKWIGSEDK